MIRSARHFIPAVSVLALACVHVKASVDHGNDVSAGIASGAFAHIYYWKAKPGKLEEYNRYIRDLAEPIDREAQRAGAFVSVTTYFSADTLSPWTHMRIFILKDSAQLAALGDALNAAGARLEPDSVKRRVRGEYSATLRDRVGDAVVTLLR